MIVPFEKWAQESIKRHQHWPSLGCAESILGRIYHRHQTEQLQATRWELETALSDKKVELANEETISEYVVDLRSLLSKGSLTERKALIKSFVQEVEVTGKQVILSYSIPVSQKGISREEVSAPPIVRNGGR